MNDSSTQRKGSGDGAGGTKTPRLDVRDLVVDRGERRVLEGFSIQVGAGEIFGLLKRVSPRP